MRTPMAEFEWSTSIVNNAATTETQSETEPDSDSLEAIAPTSSSSGSPPVASPALPHYPTTESDILPLDILHPKPIRRVVC